MLKGYLRLGAKVLGAPAWDPDFNTVDLPIMARMADLSPRYKKYYYMTLDFNKNEKLKQRDKIIFIRTFTLKKNQD